ncbi:splicing factor 3B subunit 2-like [Quercus lobata]|uniref:splicing factor 3B subunit 2-like n=1 Tax=Quercus lobata TaxID=97700 RepID=UPI001247EEDC|nr:splicing factor 3B subunit 2-like [Quercus lobata]
MGIKAFPQVEVEYVLEPAELDDGMDEKFRKIFSQLSFRETTATQDNDNKDEPTENVASTKKADSNSEEEEQDNPQEEKGVSNKKKLQRQMQIAKLKQICSRPDVVEVWDATSADSKLLVFLKS